LFNPPVKPATTRGELGQGTVRNPAVLAVEENAEKVEPPFDPADEGCWTATRRGDTIVSLFSFRMELMMKVELVTNLKRQATKILADLHASKEPVLITEHGRPSAYLVDVADFELMQRRMRILEGVAKGERAILEGRTASDGEAREKLHKWLK